jgi:hypothetical protein
LSNNKKAVMTVTCTTDRREVLYVPLEELLVLHVKCISLSST